MDIQLYALQLVKIGIVFVFLGRGILEQDSESQEEEDLFEIFPVQHFVQFCHQIANSHVSSYSSQFTACAS